MGHARAIALAVVVIACGSKSEAPPAAASGSGSGSAPVVAPDAPAKPALVELLHAVPSRLRVSSKVANRKIRPEHMIDRDLATAWNSGTGDLVGAWIEVVVPAAAAIAELRMTAGHTGKGAKGEDYFTLNHRITKVSLLRDDKVLATATLDPQRRDLQTIAIATSGGTLRIRVDETLAGSRPLWREVCVSELEVWGTPPPDWTPPPAPLAPTVEVSPQPAVSSLEQLCDYAKTSPAQAAAEAKQRAEMCNAEGGSEERIAVCISESAAAAPECSTQPVTIERLAAPWRRAVLVCERSDGPWGAEECGVVIALGGKLLYGPKIAQPEPYRESGGASVEGARVQDVVPGDLPELVLDVSKDDRRQLVVCRATPQPACSDPIELRGTGWAVTYKLEPDGVALAADDGKPPADALGKKQLVFR